MHPIDKFLVWRLAVNLYIDTETKEIEIQF